MVRLRIKALLINSLIKYGLVTQCRPAHKPGSLGCQTPSQAVYKLRTHNLVCRTMHISDWPKKPNMVPRPNLCGESFFFFSATIHSTKAYSLCAHSGCKFLTSSGPTGVNFSFLSGLFVFRCKFLTLSGPLGVNFSFLSGLFVFGHKLLN